MDIFKNRFPDRAATRNALAACMLPVFLWSIVNMFREVPSWFMRMSIWDLIGAIAYTQAFALMESLVIFLLIFILALLLPERFFRKKFVALTAMTITVCTVWFIVSHYNDEIIRAWGMKQFLLWSAVLGITLIIPYFIVQKVQKVGTAIESAVKFVSVLSFFYMMIGIMGIIIVILRNISEVL